MEEIRLEFLASSAISSFAVDGANRARPTLLRYDVYLPPSVFDLRHPDDIQRKEGLLAGALRFRFGEPSNPDDPVPRDREIILSFT